MPSALVSSPGTVAMAQAVVMQGASAPLPLTYQDIISSPAAPPPASSSGGGISEFQAPAPPAPTSCGCVPWWAWLMTGVSVVGVGTAAVLGAKYMKVKRR